MHARDSANPRLSTNSTGRSIGKSISTFHGVRWQCAVCVVLLGLVLLGPFGLTSGLFRGRLLSQEVEPVPYLLPSPASSEEVERKLTYEGPAFGPGDGEPAVNFRLKGIHPDGGLLSVQIEGQHLYTMALPRADLVDPAEVADGHLIKITQRQIEEVLRRKFGDPDLKFDDPDLPPVTVSCVLYCGRTMGFLETVTWNGYLQGCWLEFPELAQPTLSAEDEPPKPLLKPRVDISSTLGQAMPIDVRLERNTIYYMLVASEDREAVLLHPENPELYSRARILAGGTFSWKQNEDELDVQLEEELEDGAGPENKHLQRLKYTPNAEKMYLVLWALHRTEEPAPAEEGEEPAVDVQASDPESKESPRVNGWTRSVVYEFTNGLPELEEDAASLSPAAE